MSELGNGGRVLYEKSEYLSAACIARAVLETSAALSYDVKHLDAIWAECRTAAPIRGYPVPPTINILRSFVRNTMFAGRWKTDSPIGVSFERVNILTAIEHLGRAEPRTARVYDWLCNVVHPSVGSTMLYQADVEIESWAMVLHHARERYSIGPVQSAITQAMSIALATATASVDRAVELLDDIALTTRCTALPGQPYWRRHALPPTNGICPCRSGLPYGVCAHEWGADHGVHQ
jgi:hypothetical protein